MCDVAWYNEFLGLNPDERRKRDLIVQFAESRGGDVERYFREIYPRYWMMVESKEPGTEGDALGLTPAQQARLIADMSKVVLPALRSARASAATESAASSPSGGSTPSFPKTVPHL